MKPQNLLLREDGTVKVADFGIARAAETTALTQVGTVLGTAAYLSPEQALGEEVTAAADVYSLGAVLYELLTGRPPYEFDSLADLAAKQAAGQIAPVGELAPDVPRGVEDAVMRSLARNPAYRPGLGGRVRAELGAERRADRAAAPPTRVAALARRELALARRWRRCSSLAAIVLGSRSARAAAARARRRSRGSTVVQPIPRGANAQQQAQKIAAWLRARAARP